MITCNRCGKENQDHYKFCLGCGNDIRGIAAAAKVEPPRPEPTPETPPAPSSAAQPEQRVTPDPGATPQPQTQPKKPSGIPWGDSPKMPAPLNLAKAAEQLGKPMAWTGDTPTPPPEEPLAIAATIDSSSAELRSPLAASIGRSATPPASRPVTGSMSSSMSSGAVSTDSPRAAGVLGKQAAAALPASQSEPSVVVSPSIAYGTNPLASSGLASGPETPPPVAATPALAPPPAAPAAAPAPVAAAPVAPASTPETCPACGKPVIAGFAFCGVCGTRLAPAAPAASAAAAAGKTMFLAPQPVAAPVAEWRLMVIRPDGSEGGSLSLRPGVNAIGRGQGALFDGDLYLSPRHAEFVVSGDGLVARDTNSLNGVFVKTARPEILMPGDVFRIGQELIRFDVIAPPGPLEDGTEVAGTPNPGYWGRLTVIIGRDLDGAAFPLLGESTTLGRERGEVLFPDDGYVSGTHARVAIRDGQAELTDLGSSNGTFLRIRGERALTSGTFVLMGQQLFRLECR